MVTGKLNASRNSRRLCWTPITRVSTVVTSPIAAVREVGYRFKPYFCGIRGDEEIWVDNDNVEMKHQVECYVDTAQLEILDSRISQHQEDGI